MGIKEILPAGPNTPQEGAGFMDTLRNHFILPQKLHPTYRKKWRRLLASPEVYGDCGIKIGRSP
jgi:hypothetical protein